MTDTIRHFLTEMWENAPTDHFFLIWTLPDKRSRWFRCTDPGIESAADVAGSLDDQDVYMGVSLSSQSFGTRQRITALEAAGLVGLWADVDYADPVHKKPNLPTDEQAARQLLADTMPPVSMLVHSGNGLQAWWLLDNPWMFASQQEQAAGADLAQRWVATLRAGAEEHGWTIDATHDLARVMRVPGSYNHKSDPPKPVRIIDDTDVRYGLEELRTHASAPPVDQITVDVTAKSDSVNFQLSADASPPFMKWEALRKVDKKIEKTWERERRDLNDQSPSGYDLALANYAAMADWSDQEIADLLLAARAKHGEDLKLNRPDYYARTIRKARDSASRSSAAEDIDATLHELEVAPLEERDEQRRGLLDSLSPVLKTGVLRVERYNTEPATFRMLTESGWVSLGKVDDLLKQTGTRARIGEVTRTMFPRMKAAEWDRIVEAIVRSAEEVDVGPEPSTAGSTVDWLDQYLQQHHPAETLTEDVVLARVPFRKDGHTHLFASNFRNWLEHAEGEKLNRNQSSMRLRLIGAKPKRINVTVGGSPTSRSVWKLPTDWKSASDRPEHDED